MLRINNLKIEFRGIKLLEETDLFFHSGLVYTIYGDSGVGKSSLLNKIGLISGDLSELEYYYNNQHVDIGNEKEKACFIAQHIGFIFQQQNLLHSLSVYDNLALPLRLKGVGEEKIHHKIMATLESFDMEHLVEVELSELSGGEEQRIAIIRALLVDKSIILADEPTNSLDQKNSKKVCELLKKLAVEHGKIVIIVSHDEKVIQLGDVILEFNNRRLIRRKEKSLRTKELEIELLTNDVILQNNQQLNRTFFNRRKKILSKLVLGLVSLMVALSVISINVSKLFNSKYEIMIQNSLENGVLVVNDTLNINTSKVYDDFLSFSDSTIDSIVDSDNVDEYLPYIEMPYFGMTLENAKDFSNLIEGDGTPNITISGKTIQLVAPFSVQPLFNTNVTQRNIQYFDRINEKGVYLSEQFIFENQLQELVVPGSEIALKVYVPSLLFDNTIIKDEQILEGDGTLYEPVEIQLPILGIVKKEYPFNYSIYGNTLFMKANEIKKLQSTMVNDEKEVLKDLDGFKLKKWKPNAIHLKLNQSTSVLDEIKRIRSISSDLSIVSSSEDYVNFENAIEYIRNIMMGIAIILIILIVATLFFVFYMLNGGRKIEVGILKALGFPRKSIILMYIYELINYGKLVFYRACVWLILFTLILFSLLQLTVIDTIYFFIISLFWIGPLSFIVIVASGIIPIVSASGESAADTIRLNK